MDRWVMRSDGPTASSRPRRSLAVGFLLANLGSEAGAHPSMPRVERSVPPECVEDIQRTIVTRKVCYYPLVSARGMMRLRGVDDDDL